MDRIRQLLSLRRVMVFALLVYAAAAAPGISAKQVKQLKVSASGVVLSPFTPCGPLTVCQTTSVSGNASHIGRFTVVSTDRVSLVDFSYTCDALFTTPNGDGFSTVCTGQANPATGMFMETHHIVGGSGTGRFLQATLDIVVTGTADFAGHVQISGDGTIDF